MIECFPSQKNEECFKNCSIPGTRWTTKMNYVTTNGTKYKKNSTLKKDIPIKGTHFSISPAPRSFTEIIKTHNNVD